MGPAYVAIAGLYLVSTLLMLGIVTPARIQEGAAVVLRQSPLRDLKEGIAYVWSTPRMNAVMWIAFLANLTAYPLSTGLLPYIARDIYGTDQAGLGYLSASFAVGSLVGSIVLSLVGGVRVARLMVGATVIWYALLLLFAQVRGMPLGVACLVMAGFAQSLAMISIAVILMRTASERFRGRVMGVRMLAIYGLPLGLLAAGELVSRMGFAATGTLYAASGLLLIVMIVLHWRAELWHVQAPANAR
jgi:predicted MFS family arabinose efflux permease